MTQAVSEDKIARTAMAVGTGISPSRAGEQT